MKLRAFQPKKKKYNLRAMTIFSFVGSELDRNPCSVSLCTEVQTSLTSVVSEGLLGSSFTHMDKRKFLYLQVRVRSRGK